MKILLPYPRLRGKLSVEEALLLRRSIREFSPEPLGLDEVSQLLWACQGISEPDEEFRTCPSAGATYPLNLYLVVKSGGVSELEAGVYKYLIREHALELIKRGDFSDKLYAACLAQRWVREASINIVLTAIYARTTRYYGERGYRYVILEAGHACQNVYLQAVALGLGAVAIGAFYDSAVADIVNASRGEEPLYVISIGKPRKSYPDASIITEKLRKYWETNRARQ